jgi:alkanesulfonate monooxygenase SsuD/methylene tetrahydromethanopterin reductase-like flavin-dependent oxidoreductase (luciferase family)
MTNDPHAHVRPLGDAVPVPVFNCRLILTQAAQGQCLAIAAELADLQETAATPREAMQKLVARFKQKVAAYHTAGEAIPWLKPGRSLQPGEQEFFIAVHL